MADISKITIPSSTYNIKDATARSSADAKIPLNTAGGIKTCEGGGQYSYCLLATINITAGYINRPVVFEISGRGRYFSRVQVIFQSVSGNDPGLQGFISDNDTNFWMYKSATSTWQLYAQYNEVWGKMVVHRITGAGADIGVTVNCTNASTLPSGTKAVLFNQNTNTTYSAGTGLSLSGTTFNHSNSVTAQTTQAVYPIKIDAQGHISAYGSAVTIPSAVTESTVSGWGFTKNAGTITGIKMNGASKGTSGVVDLGTVLTSHQDISGKVDKINITAQTTQALYPIKINAQGQITAYGSAVTSMTPSSHSHGNITNAGDITATATIASGDRLVINDESASKVTNSSITFGTDTTKFLRNDGTWATAGGGSASTITENTQFNISGTTFYIELVS